MYKFYSLIVFLIFSNATFCMEKTGYTSQKNNNSIQNISYNSRINNQIKKHNNIQPIPSIYSSVTSSGITKPFKKIDYKKEHSSFIYDKYTARRGDPKMLHIRCAECNHLLIKYQKDGPGRLLRCYLDRIHAPENLKNRQHEQFNVRTSPYLSCQNCRLIVGKPMIYQSENRPAYKMEINRFYIE
jgi:hypothetical protein